MASHLRQQLWHTAQHWFAFIGLRRVISGVVTTILIAGTAWFVLKPSPIPVELVLPHTATSSVSIPSAGTVHVHVAGAVNKPGVYVLPAQSRVVDAVRAAGGSLSIADLERINLAQTVTDAEQIFIPRRTSTRPRVTVAPRLRPTPRTTSTTLPNGASQGSRIININTATASQLESLTGVGPATARAIISYRTTKGPFAKVEDLLNVPGIGPAKLSAMRSEISVS